VGKKIICNKHLFLCLNICFWSSSLALSWVSMSSIALKDIENLAPLAPPTYINNNNLLYNSKNLSAVHWGLWPRGRGKVSLPLSPGFESQCACLLSPWCFTCLLGLQGVQWVWKLVVVRVNWPGHLRLKKKKLCVVYHFLYCIHNNHGCKSRVFFTYYH
jgi:hypothetical protein